MVRYIFITKDKKLSVPCGSVISLEDNASIFNDISGNSNDLDITKEENFRDPYRSVISLEDFVGGKLDVNKEDYVAIFNDMTRNFDDLGIWDSRKDLYGKKLFELGEIIDKILRSLEDQGHKKKELTEKEMNCGYIANWEWGYYDGRGVNKNLPNNDRISILMHHLDNILWTIKEYDENYYIFVDKREYN